MENIEKVKIVILAAGKGTRMQSRLPKVLAPLQGKHMIRHLLQSVDQTGIDGKPIIVVGYEKELVMKELGEKYEYVIQEEQKGTGHAVLSTEKACIDAKHIIVISGDQPFIKSETIKNLLARHLEKRPKLTVTTTELENFEDWRSVFLKFGRILRKDGKIIDREYKDASEEERVVKEINVSCYAFDAKWLWQNLKKVTDKKNAQKEFYLTDLWEMASLNNEEIEVLKIDPVEALSVNTKEELEVLEKVSLN